MRSFTLLGVLALCGPVAGDGPSPVRTEPPQASFTVREGWLHVRVTDRGRPVPGASVRCLVGTQEWAAGETGPDGAGAFPRPTRDWCQIVIDLGAGPSAPVPLTFLPDGSVVPAGAAVLDGTAACCVEAPWAPLPVAPAPRPAPDWLIALAVGSLAGGLAFIGWRRWLLRHERPAGPP